MIQIKDGAIVLTYEVAMSISRDFGDRHMRKHCRKTWNDDDYNAAVHEFNRIWPLERHLEAERFLAAQKEAA